MDLGLSNSLRVLAEVAWVGRLTSEPVGGRHPGGAGAERRAGGQTAAVLSTVPGREVGRRA